LRRERGESDEGGALLIAATVVLITSTNGEMNEDVQTKEVINLMTV
jgi:hypothetical protein